MKAADKEELSSAQKKRDMVFVTICFVIYAAITAGRYNYNASMVAIESDLKISKDTLGSVFAFFEMAYGTGQFLAAFISKRSNHRMLIFGSLLLSAAANILLPFFHTIAAMRAIWFMNGVAQCVAWSCVVKTLAENVSSKFLLNAIVLIGITYPVGTAITYGMAVAGVTFNNWGIPFFGAAALMLVSAVIWMRFYTVEYYRNPIKLGGESVEKREKKGEEWSTDKEDSLKRRARIRFTVSVIGLFCSVSFLGYFIKDGVSSWLPTIIHEIFHLSQGASIALTVILPCIGVFASIMGKYLYRKWGVHAFINMLAMGMVVLSAMGVLYAMGAKVCALAVGGCVVIFSAMAMVTNVVTSMAPLNFRGKIDSGMFAGFTSGVGHFGGATGVWVLGKVADHFGWNSVFYSVICAAGLALVVAYMSYLAESRR